MTNTTQPEQDWYFTFGHGHVLPDGSDAVNHYVVIHGTYDSSREEMFRRFGNRWAFQYASAEQGEFARFGMTKYGDTITAAPPDPSPAAAAAEVPDELAAPRHDAAQASRDEADTEDDNPYPDTYSEELVADYRAEETAPRGAVGLDGAW